MKNLARVIDGAIATAIGDGAPKSAREAIEAARGAVATAIAEAQATTPIALRARFMVSEVTPSSRDESTRIVLMPQYDSTIEEDRRLMKATPVGHIDMVIDTPAALAALVLEKGVYVDFSPIESVPESVEADPNNTAVVEA